MDTMRAAYTHWPTAALVLGIGAFIIGIMSHGDGGSDLRSTGLLITGIAVSEIRHARTRRYLRTAYRSGRGDKRRHGPTLVALPRREENR
jgi:hypothetical protein